MTKFSRDFYQKEQPSLVYRSSVRIMVHGVQVEPRPRKASTISRSTSAERQTEEDSQRRRSRKESLGVLRSSIQKDDKDEQLR